MGFFLFFFFVVVSIIVLSCIEINPKNPLAFIHPPQIKPRLTFSNTCRLALTPFEQPFNSQDLIVNSPL